MSSRQGRLPTKIIILFVGITAFTAASARLLGKALSPSTVMTFSVNGTVTRNYALRILDPLVGSSVNAFSVDFKGCRPRKDRTVICVPLHGDETVSDILWMKVWAALSLFGVSSDGWWFHLDFDAFPKQGAVQIKLRTSQLTAQRDPVFDVNSGVYFAFVKGRTNRIIEEWAAYRQFGQAIPGQASNLEEQHSLNKLREVDVRKVRTVPDGHLAYHSYGGDGKSKESLVEMISEWRTSPWAMPEFVIIFLWFVTMARLAPGIELMALGRTKVSKNRISKAEILYSLHMAVMWYLCVTALIRSSFYVLGSTTFDYRDSFFDLGVADFYDTHRRYFMDERGACTVAWNAAMSCLNLTHPINVVVHHFVLHMIATDSSGRTEMFRTHLIYNIMFLFIARTLLEPMWEPRYRQQVLGTHASKGRRSREKEKTEDTHIIYISEASGRVGSQIEGILAIWPFYWNKKVISAE